MHAASPGINVKRQLWEILRIPVAHMSLFFPDGAPLADDATLRDTFAIGSGDRGPANGCNGEALVCAFRNRVPFGCGCATCTTDPFRRPQSQTAAHLAVTGDVIVGSHGVDGGGVVGIEQGVGEKTAPAGSAPCNVRVGEDDGCGGGGGGGGGGISSRSRRGSGGKSAAAGAASTVNDHRRQDVCQPFLGLRRGFLSAGPPPVAMRSGSAAAVPSPRQSTANVSPSPSAAGGGELGSGGGGGGGGNTTAAVTLPAPWA
jgi:hypothetical protein